MLKLIGCAWIFRIGVVSEGGGRQRRRRPSLAHNPWIGAQVASALGPGFLRFKKARRPRICL